MLLVESRFFAVRAKGASVWDADDNEYVDYVGTWGPAIVGHADDRDKYTGEVKIIGPDGPPQRETQAATGRRSISCLTPIDTRCG